MPPLKGSKQERGVARRRDIVDAATELFGRSGYQATSLNAIAERARITAPGLLHHFESKEALMQVVVDELDRADRARWEELTELGGVRALRELPAMVAKLSDQKDLARVLAVVGAESLDPDAVAHQFFVRRYRVARRWVAGLIRSGQERGEIRTSADADGLAAQIVAAQTGLLQQYLLDPGRVNLRALYTGYIDMVVRDIAEEPTTARRRRG